jgi:uncharacterized membrane protein YeaQ/YmgE (transglycosylase-associated protein family)
LPKLSHISERGGEVDVLTWIIFGAIAGWIAGILAGTRDRQGCITNIVVGIAGAVIGGAGYKVITGEEWDFDFFSLTSFLVAIGGAVLLLFILRALGGGFD